MNHEEIRSPFEWAEDECSEVPVQTMVATARQQGISASPAPDLNVTAPYTQQGVEMGMPLRPRYFVPVQQNPFENAYIPASPQYPYRQQSGSTGFVPTVPTIALQSNQLRNTNDSDLGNCNTNQQRSEVVLQPVDSENSVDEQPKSRLQKLFGSRGACSEKG